LEAIKEKKIFIKQQKRQVEMIENHPMKIFSQIF